jgi:hypothetical protein
MRETPHAISASTELANKKTVCLAGKYHAIITTVDCDSIDNIRASTTTLDFAMEGNCTVYLSIC